MSVSSTAPVAQHFIQEFIDEDLSTIFEKDYHATDSHITLGDLHANFCTLLKTLVTKGFISMPKADYESFYALLNKEDIDLTDLATVDEMIKNIQVQPGHKDTKLTLVGDVLSDRRGHDFIMLQILEFMDKETINFKIPLSNHDLEHSYQAEHNYEAPGIEERRYCFQMGDTQIVEGPPVARSLNKMMELLKIYPGFKERALEMYQAYKKHWVLADYNLSACKNKITVMYHSPAGLATLRKCAHKTLTEFRLNNSEELAKTIDKMNNAFQDIIVKEGWFKRYILNENNPITNPFIKLAWYRISNFTADYEGMFTITYDYHLFLIHGHDEINPNAKDYPQVFNLNQPWGQTPEADKGKYIIAVLPKT